MRAAGDTLEIASFGTGIREFIAICFPTLGRVSIYWAARAFQGLRHPMNRSVANYVVTGLEVGLARNECVARALSVEQRDPTRRCSHVFFVDDDVFVHPDALLKLLEHRRPIVSGLYYLKASVPTPLILHAQDGGTARSWKPGELVECWAHGMGLTLIEADVFRRLRDETALGLDERGNPAWFATSRDVSVLTPQGTQAIHNQTEDVHFLRRAHALGYQPAVDTSPQAFGFHWADAEQRAYPLKQWDEYCRTGRITWETDDGTVTWEAA
jgi:hypothetical protein